VTRPTKTAELVAREIRRRIIRGELKEGDSLPVEAELCATFGISKPTLREAFRILESEDLISIRQGGRRGPTVHEPTTQTAGRYVGLLLQHRGASIRDVDAAFEMILPVAARRIAARHSDGDLEALRQLVDELAAARDDFPRFLELAVGFNYLLLDLTGNTTIAVLGRLLADIATLHIADMAHEWQPPNRKSFVDAATRGCRQLVDLIEAGDAAGAEHFWEAQFERSARRAAQFASTDNLLDLLP
jgi:DNA-binding FadR family transcriptional regulator